MHTHESYRYGGLEDDKHTYDSPWDPGIHDDGPAQNEYQDYQSSTSDVVDVYREMLDNPFVDDALAELLETRVNDMLDR